MLPKILCGIYYNLMIYSMHAMISHLKLCGGFAPAKQCENINFFLIVPISSAQWFAIIQSNPFFKSNFASILNLPESTEQFGPLCSYCVAQWEWYIKDIRYQIRNPKHAHIWYFHAKQNDRGEFEYNGDMDHIIAQIELWQNCAQVHMAII